MSILAALSALSSGCEAIVGIEERTPNAGVSSQQACTAGKVSGSYYDEVMSTAPVLYWRFEDAPGAVEIEAEIGPAGRNHGAMLGIDGLDAEGLGNGRAALFRDGAVVQTAGDVPAIGDAPWSLEMWFWPRGPDLDGGGHQQLMSKFADCCEDPKQHGYKIWLYGPELGTMDFVRVALVDDVANRWLSAASVTPTAEQWHQVVAVWDPDEERYPLKIYYDGELRGEASSYGQADNDAPLVIGGSAPGWDGFDGAIDELSVYDWALDCDTVARHFAAAGAR